VKGSLVLQEVGSFAERKCSLHIVAASPVVSFIREGFIFVTWELKVNKEPPSIFIPLEHFML
jgi:hypothetical protein